VSKTKIKSAFFCSNCGAQSPKWIGKCPSCGEWNTYVEEIIKNETTTKYNITNSYSFSNSPKLIQEIDYSSEPRINTGSSEMNRVLGGGLVPGSLILIGGEPGIGKSTLMLQISLKIKNQKILYVSGEESEKQLRLRAGRIGIESESCYILTETSTDNIFKYIEEIKPDIVIIDSVQTLQTNVIDSSAGSISQIRECTSEFQRFTKQTGVPVFLIGHITKDGSIAGPKILEHIVDTVLQFEGDRHYGYRIIRASKNRFGSTSEIGIFEMYNAGLREVSNPSEILISQRDDDFSGITIAATLEGMRPMLIETQALVSTAVYGTPQRSTTGFDIRRLSMLLAVLEKRCGFKLGTKDVFVNIAGGIRVDDPAIDLAVVSAVLSSNQDMPIDKKVCFAAEVGLSGEIRPVQKIEQRITEAEKLGFSKIYISQYNFKNFDTNTLQIKIKAVNKIEEIFADLFG
jgi:DNA repair protein RadA/Sms